MQTEAAAHALSSYNEARDFDDTLEADIIDLMTDLLHLAKQKGLDVDMIHTIIHEHFQEEVNDERGIIPENSGD